LSFLYFTSGADADRYFTASQVTEADSNCDPDKVVSSVRKMMQLKLDGANSNPRAINILEEALKINPHAEVISSWFCTVHAYTQASRVLCMSVYLQVLWVELMKIFSSKLHHPPFDLNNLNMVQDVCQRAFTTTKSYTILHQVQIEIIAPYYTNVFNSVYWCHQLVI